MIILLQEQYLFCYRTLYELNRTGCTLIARCDIVSYIDQLYYQFVDDNDEKTRVQTQYQV